MSESLQSDQLVTIVWSRGDDGVMIGDTEKIFLATLREGERRARAPTAIEPQPLIASLAVLIVLVALLGLTTVGLVIRLFVLAD